MSKIKEKIEPLSEKPSKGDILSFSEIILTLAKNFKIIIFLPSVLCVLQIIYVQFLAAPVFISQAKILSSSNSGVSQAAGIAAQFGISIPQISDEQEWVYPEIVKSRKISKLMLKRRFDTNEFGSQKLLLQILTYGNRQPEFGIDTLIKFGVGKMQSMIEIKKNGNFYDLSIKAKEPIFARDLATALIEELDAHQKKYNKSKTSEARLFIEERIDETRKELESAEEKLKNFRDRNRRIENSPSLQLEETRLVREASVLTGVYTTLKQQLETTKIEEVKESNYVIVLDPPEAPLDRAYPRKKMMVIFTGIIGLFLGVAFALIRGYLEDSSLHDKNIVRKAKKILFNNIFDLTPNFLKR
tara:strand:+ start:68 stop:1138 length:1071 start_codon:yes stop_codon:yes gene_type:complete